VSKYRGDDAAPRFQYHDFVCPRCEEQEEHFVEVNLGEEIFCQSCASDGETVVMVELEFGTTYMAPIRKGNGDFNERERERLEKRANDHWQKKGRSEALEKEWALNERYLKKSGQ
jgi:hypothetical protein